MSAFFIIAACCAPRRHDLEGALRRPARILRWDGGREYGHQAEIEQLIARLEVERHPVTV
jgi:hypothetical protein